jgi:hypothetical protein
MYLSGSREIKEVSDKQELLMKAEGALIVLQEDHQVKLKHIQEERDIEKEEMKSQIQELETVS